MAENRAEILVEALLTWGVSILFGRPGGSAHGMLEFLRSHQSRIRFLRVHQDEAAAFMASAYAKYSGKLGVCVAESDMASEQDRNFLLPAATDGEAVLAMTFRSGATTFGSHEAAFSALEIPGGAGIVFRARVTDLSEIASVVDDACRSALHDRGLAHIDFLVDLAPTIKRPPLSIARPPASKYAQRSNTPEKIIEFPHSPRRFA
ncbi:MAG: thiamine pyrophosphate-binding protein [Candidatus Acidiferrales bacterium]